LKSILADPSDRPLQRDTGSTVDVHDPESAATDQLVGLRPSDAQHRRGLVDLQQKPLALLRSA
jgi:hypothetical protein